MWAGKGKALRKKCSEFAGQATYHPPSIGRRGWVRECRGVAAAIISATDDQFRHQIIK
jgi:hypothetical protein